MRKWDIEGAEENGFWGCWNVGDEDARGEQANKYKIKAYQ